VKLLGEVPIGKSPDWITFTPDSKTVYVSTGGVQRGVRDRHRDSKGTRPHYVGESPKRVITATLH
jgi:hypothetical protein